MSYLVATDLDGTLLRRDFTVSARTREALQGAVAAGVAVVYATGRPPRWLPEVYEVTGLSPITVCANGALTLVDEEPLDINAIPDEVVNEVRGLLVDHREDFVIHTEQWRGNTLKLLAALPDVDHGQADDQVRDPEPPGQGGRAFDQPVRPLHQQEEADDQARHQSNHEQLGDGELHRRAEQDEVG